MKQEKIYTVKLSHLLFGIFVGSIFAAKGLGLYDGQLIFKIVLILAGISWIIKIFLTDYTSKELLECLGILVLGTISYIISGDKGLLLYIMLLVGAKDIETKKILQIALWIWGIVFIGITTVTSLHIIDGPFKVHVKWGELIIRWGLGYSHPNVLHVSYLILCLLIGYFLAERVNMKWICAMAIGNILIFLYSVSFTGAIVVFIYLAMEMYFFVFKQNIGLKENILIKVIAIACVLVSLIAPVLLKGRLFDIVNRLVNTRLNLSRRYLMEYPVSLLGHKISEITDRSATMDCSYVYAYVAYGIIVFAFLLIIYGRMICEFCKKNRIKELTVILACLIAGITEPFLFNSSFKNISILFAKECKEKCGRSKIIWNGSRFDKKIKLPYLNARIRYREILVYRKKMIISFIITCGIGMLITGAVIKSPERIIVPRSESDLDQNDYAERNIENSDIAPEDIVYGVPRDGTPWMKLEGNALKLEKIRSMVAYSCIFGAGVVMIEGIYFRCKKRA